jgi:hypothetical protein
VGARASAIKDAEMDLEVGKSSIAGAGTILTTKYMASVHLTSSHEKKERKKNTMQKSYHPKISRYEGEEKNSQY